MQAKGHKRYSIYSRHYMLNIRLYSTEFPKLQNFSNIKLLLSFWPIKKPMYDIYTTVKENAGRGGVVLTHDL